MIIDFHAHLKRDYIEDGYDVAALLADMKENKIDKRVVSAMEGSGIYEQNNAVSQIIMAYPEKLIGFAVIDPKKEDSVEEMKRVTMLKGIKGVEFNSFEHGYFPENCPNLDPILNIISEIGWPVKVYTGTGANTMPQQWAIYAKRYPDIPFIMLHMGGFDFGYSCVQLAYEQPNIYLETSNQFEVQIFRKAFDIVPCKKFLFGSQFPNKFTKCSIDQFEMFDLTEEFKTQLFYVNAKRILE